MFMFPQHDQAAYSCNMFMQHEQSAWRHGHEVRACSMDIQHGHAARTCSSDKQYGQAACTCRMHGDMDIERGHEIDMLKWLPIFQPRPSLSQVPLIVLFSFLATSYSCSSISFISLPKLQYFLDIFTHALLFPGYLYSCPTISQMTLQVLFSFLAISTHALDTISWMSLSCLPLTQFGEYWFPIYAYDGNRPLAPLLRRRCSLLYDVHIQMSCSRNVPLSKRPITKRPARETSHTQNVPQLRMSHFKNVPSLNKCPK